MMTDRHIVRRLVLGWLGLALGFHIGSAPIGAQVSPQPLQGTQVPRVHGPFRNPQHRGDLPRRHLLQVPQHQHLPLARGQVRQQRPQRGVALGVQHAGFRTLGGDRGVGEFGDGLGAIPAAGPKRVGDLVGGDAIAERLGTTGR